MITPSEISRSSHSARLIDIPELAATHEIDIRQHNPQSPLTENELVEMPFPTASLKRFTHSKNIRNKRLKFINMNNTDYLELRAPIESSQSDSHRRLGSIIGLYIVLFAFSAHISYATEWQAVDTTTDGIQIFKREVNDRGLIAFRGIGVVDAPLPLVATVIFDTDRRREWIEGLVDSRIIRWGDNDNFIEYDHIEMPFFMSERDFVSNIIISFDLSKKQMVFHYQASDDPSVTRTNYIRGEVIDMTFILRSIDNDKKTTLDASFLCDPKGSIPKWLVNYFLEDWPKRTFRNLRKEVQKDDFSVDIHFSKLFKQGTIDP